MIHTRSERPYWSSILVRKSESVVLSEDHLISQRKAVRGHHQGDHHLHAVAALVAAVAELTLVLERRVALEIGAGDIVKS